MKIKVLEVFSSVIKEVEKNFTAKKSEEKLSIAIRAIQATIKPIGIDCTDIEIKDIVEGLVASYNITGRFLHKSK
jgi:hypothetical protein